MRQAFGLERENQRHRDVVDVDVVEQERRVARDARDHARRGRRG
jgi:hypothetical protein